MPVYDDVAALDFALADLPQLPRPDRVLVADPRDFEVVYAINPHMQDASGALQCVDRGRAREQWKALLATFELLGLAVDRLRPLDGHPDLVFCANQVLPIPGAALPDGRPRLVPSRMAAPERRGEVPHVVRALVGQGYEVELLQGDASRLEGMGDGLWHPGRRLLWAGVGPRSAREAWEEIARRFELPVLLLELADPDFYHLDTALALLAEDAALWHPPALAPRSQELVEALIPRRIVVERDEARAQLACNAFSPDGRRVVLQRGAIRTCAALRAAGFEPVEVETGEFLKSGGSVFCMKLFHGPIRARAAP